MFSSLRNCSILLITIVLLAFAVPATAQTITGSISGAVADSTGGMIPSATVTLVSDKTGQTRTAATNGEGRFNFGLL